MFLDCFRDDKNTDTIHLLRDGNMQDYFAIISNYCRQQFYCIDVFDQVLLSESLPYSSVFLYSSVCVREILAINSSSKKLKMMEQQSFCSDYAQGMNKIC